MLREARDVFVIGCGTAGHAALAAQYFLARIAGRRVTFATASEFSYLQDFVAEGSLVVAFSQSGETYELRGQIDVGTALIQAAADEIDRLLADDRRDLIRQIAETICRRDHMFVIGRGLSYPLALETALKVKEVSYVHAEGFAGGELKHGVIALIEPG